MQINQKTMPGLKPEPVGVGGFLLFICIQLTILNPLAVFGSLHNQIINNPPRDTENFIYLYIYFGFLLLDGLMAVLSLVAGVLLWREKRAGLMLTKIFFIAMSVLGIFVILTTILISSVAEATDSSKFVEEITVLFVFKLIIPVLQFIYLLKSVRVQNTYKLKNTTALLTSGPVGTG